MDAWKARNPNWNKPKLYAPKYQDRFWRSNEPYLEGAEGWIIEECSYQPKDEHNVGQGKWVIINKEWWGKKIKVIGQRLGHKGWGKYEGLLYAEIIDSGKKINLDYKIYLRISSILAFFPVSPLK